MLFRNVLPVFANHTDANLINYQASIISCKFAVSLLYSIKPNFMWDLLRLFSRGNFMEMFYK